MKTLSQFLNESAELAEATLGGEKYKGKSNPNNKLPHDHNYVKNAHANADKTRKEITYRWSTVPINVVMDGPGSWKWNQRKGAAHQTDRLSQVKKAATKILKSSPHDDSNDSKKPPKRFKARY